MRGHGGHGGHGGWGRGGPDGPGCGPKSRFVSDVTLSDGTVVEPGATVSKIWKMSNQGNMAWPEGTTLLHVAGDSLQADPAAPIEVAPCGPGEEIDITANLVAPSQPGRYIAYFRLQGPRGYRFGQRIWVMLLVSTDGEAVSSDDACGYDTKAWTEEQTRGRHGGGRHCHLRQGAQTKEQRCVARLEQMRSKAAHFSAKVAEIQAQAPYQNEKQAAKAAEKIAKFEAKAKAVLQKAAEFEASGADCVVLDPRLTPEQQKQLACAGLDEEKTAVVAAAIASSSHLGITCDVTGQSPIVGIRFTKTEGDKPEGDTFDVCEAAYAELSADEQETFEAMPIPDIALAIRFVADCPPREHLRFAEPANDEQDPDQEPARVAALALALAGAGALALAGTAATAVVAEAVPPAPPLSAGSDDGFELVDDEQEQQAPEPELAPSPAAAPSMLHESKEVPPAQAAGLSQLANMGFPADDPMTLEALRLSDGDVQTALETLLLQQEQ